MNKYFERFGRVRDIDKRKVMKRAFQKIYSSGNVSLNGMGRVVRVAMLKLTSSRFALLNSVGEYYKKSLLKKSNDVETLRDLVLYGNEKNALTRLKNLSKEVEAMVSLAEIYRKTNDEKIKGSIERFLKGKTVGDIREGAKTTIDEIKRRAQYTIWSVVPAYLISAVVGIPTLLTITGVAAYNVYKVGELNKNIETLSQLSKARSTKKAKA